MYYKRMNDLLVVAFILIVQTIIIFCFLAFHTPCVVLQCIQGCIRLVIIFPLTKPVFKQHTQSSMFSLLLHPLPSAASTSLPGCYRW